MKFLLKRLQSKKNRSAFFICSLSLKLPKKKIVTVVGKLDGVISQKIKGKKGFGYDPIFIPKNKKQTFGLIPKYIKIKMDHRYLAFKN